MIVVDAPDETVAEWSDANDYDLVGNYANSKFQPDPTEGVVECVYVSDVRSEPSKTYTFPVSRVALIDVHHADDGRRLYDRVVVDVLDRLFQTARRASGDDYWEVRDPVTVVETVARWALEGQEDDRVDEAIEPADAATLSGGDGGE